MIALRQALALAVAGCVMQAAAGQGLETAAREAQRYFDCIDSLFHWLTTKLTIRPRT